MSKSNFWAALWNAVLLITRFSSIAAVCQVLINAVMAQPPADHLRHGVNLGRFKDEVFENDPTRCCEKDGNRDDFADLKNMGFDHVRIIVKPGIMFKIDDKGNVSDIDASSREVLDSVVGNCLDHDLGVILTISLGSDDRFKDKLAVSPNAPIKWCRPKVAENASG